MTMNTPSFAGLNQLLPSKMPLNQPQGFLPAASSCCSNGRHLPSCDEDTVNSELTVAQRLLSKALCSPRFSSVYAQANDRSAATTVSRASELWRLKGHDSTRCSASSQRMARSQEDRVVVWLVWLTSPKQHKSWKCCKAVAQLRLAAKAPMAKLKLMVFGRSDSDGRSANKHSACLHCRAFSHAESTEFTVVMEILDFFNSIWAKRATANSH